MATVLEQLELDLWSDLKVALDEPEVASLQQLWHKLDCAIASLQKQQLQVAGEAILQIVEVYIRKFNSILDSLEIVDNSTGPILSDNFLSGLMRQSMRIDLSDMMEDLFIVETTKTKASFESIATPINKNFDRAMMIEQTAESVVHEAQVLAEQELLHLVEEDNVGLWRQAVSHWMQQYKSEKVSLWQLHQALNMPLVEVWLGLLYSPYTYQWSGVGEFYRNVQDIWINNE